MVGVITIGIDPEIGLGPVTLAWHGLTIAIGIVVGGLAAARWLRERDLAVDPLYTVGAVLAVGALVGARLFYVLERDPSDLLSPGQLLGTRGFTFAGGAILAAVLIILYVRRTRLDSRYLDAVVVGLPLGVAVGRIGDVINGEHYGGQSDFLLAVRNSHPEALTPNSSLAYHNGGLYEVMLAALIFAVVWPLRHRLPRVGDLAWLVLGLFALGRFFVFFGRTDSPDLALGLNNAQWTSAALLAAGLVAFGLVRRYRPPPAAMAQPP